MKSKWFVIYSRNAKDSYIYEEMAICAETVIKINEHTIKADDTIIVMNAPIVLFYKSSSKFTLDES